MENYKKQQKMQKISILSARVFYDQLLSWQLESITGQQHVSHIMPHDKHNPLMDFIWNEDNREAGIICKDITTTTTTGLQIFEILFHFNMFDVILLR